MKNLLTILVILLFASCDEPDHTRLNSDTEFFENEYCGWKLVDGFHSDISSQFVLDSANVRVKREVTFYTWNRYHLGDIICDPSNPTGDKE